MTDGFDDYPQSMGGEALGARLRRISEAIDRDASRSYALLDCKFEQRWFGVLNQLTMNGPLLVSEIAERLRITHVSVSQARNSLEKAGYVESAQDVKDARRRELRITEKGAKFVAALKPLWDAQARAAKKLNDEAGDLVAMIDRAEAALSEKSLFDRIEEELQKSGFE